MLNYILRLKAREFAGSETSHKLYKISKNHLLSAIFLGKLFVRLILFVFLLVSLVFQVQFKI